MNVKEKNFYNFGSVPTGCCSIRTIKVHNYQKEVQEYDVHRDPATNPLDHVFEVNPYKTKLEPGSVFSLNILYSPVVPFSVNYDYFSISNSSGVVIKFGVKGNSVGPHVAISQRVLVFHSSVSKTDDCRLIELRNSSKVPATFQFDINMKQSIFKLEKQCGTIPPDGKECIRITFCPTSMGCYVKRLFCLIHYERPLVIDLIGFYKSWDTVRFQDLNIVRYPQLEVVTGGYASYVHDSVTFTNYTPPLTLSTSYLDFGLTTVHAKQTIPSTVSITNHMKDAATFEWETDKSGIFAIHPQSVKISSGHSALFQVYFRPDKPNTLYGIELDGRAYWGNHCNDLHGKDDYFYQAHVPVPFSIKIVGHTLASNSNEWLPKYEVVPQSIVLPPCLPLLPVYTTFIIKQLEEQPLMFKFLSPQVTHYTLKPMQGVITEGYQIIVVQLCPSENSETAYVERWGLQFNGSSKYETNVDIRAYAEYPSLHFGKMNRIVFPAIYPGCEETVNVSVRNPTRHCLRYHYQQSTIPDNLDILDKVYVIASNEIISNTWKYTPQEPGEFSLQLKCEASVLQDCKYTVGMPYETPVKVKGICEYVELVAFPEKIDFGISSWGESRTQSFYLFNFGNCKMHYKLKVVYYTFPRSSKRLRDVFLSPLTSTLGPNEKNEIQVTICPSELGFNEFAVMYDIRVSSKSEATVPTVTDKILTVIQYEGVFPTLKICDLRIVQGGPIFCKLWLWKMLNINKLNDTLAEVPPDCMLDVPITLPEAQEGSKPLTVCLLLKNNSEIPNKWKIKRQQVCTCPLVNLTRGISFRYKEYDCPHRPLFQIYPTSGELQPYGETLLWFVVRYELQGTWQLKYIIYLSNNRSVMLTALFTVHGPINRALSTVVQRFNMHDIFLGDKDPFWQVFWIYNSLETEMPYEIDISSITAFNNSNYGVEVLKCQNTKGDIPPKSNHPILFRFCPLELKRYEISCLLRLGYTWISFITAGMGSVKYDSHIFSMRDKMPESRNIILPEDPILLSIENIIINPIATFSRVKRIFFIENTSDYYVFEYQWFRYQIPGVLEAIVTTSKNSLHPRHSHVCTLTVTTYGYPCLLSFPIKCQILNITERRNHEKSLLVRSAVDNYLQGQFDITERGEAVPVVNVPIVPAPKPFFVVMSVTTSIRSSKTLDETLPLKIQMRQTPNQEYMHSDIETQLGLRPPDVHIIVSLLEKMIWEVVYSKWFSNMVHQISEEGTPYYSQFVMEEEERCLLNKMSYCQPSRRLIESVLNDIIIDLLHTEFELGPVKKNESKFDLRKTVRKSDGTFRHDSCDCDDTESHIPKRLSDEKIKVPSGW